MQAGRGESTSRRPTDASRVTTVLVEPQFEMGDHVNGHMLSLVASGLLKKPAYYRGPYDGGAAFMLLEDPSFRAPAGRPVPRISTVFMQVIETFEIADQRRALIAYLRSRRYRVVEEPGRLKGIGSGGEEVEAAFDELGRVASLRERAKGKG